MTRFARVFADSPLRIMPTTCPRWLIESQETSAALDETLVAAFFHKRPNRVWHK